MLFNCDKFHAKRTVQREAAVKSKSENKIVIEQTDEMQGFVPMKYAEQLS